jgi:glycosyltransferase involved in cell wall biosynthesis
MRIGIEAQRLFRAKKHGMDVVARETLRALVRLAPQHTFVAFVRPGPDPCLPEASNLEVRTLRAPSYPLWEQVALPLAARRARLDVLHCTANTAPLVASVPRVVTLHDVIFLEGGLPPGGSWYQRLGNAYRRLVVPPAVRRAAAVTTVSRYEAGRIRAALPEVAGRLRVVPNAVAPHFRPLDDPAARHAVAQRYGLPRRFVFFLGNTDPKKNLPGTLAAYVRYARQAGGDALPMVVADVGRERLRAALQRLGAADLEARFVLPGYIAHADLPAVYSQCSLFLYPSLRESFGLPILEAMACGAPVLTSDCASMPEVGGEAAVLVDPRDPAAMAQAMTRVLSGPEEQLRRAMAGVRHARGFSWTRAARQMLAVYEEVAGQAVAGQRVAGQAAGGGSSEPGGGSSEAQRAETLGRAASSSAGGGSSNAGVGAACGALS